MFFADDENNPDSEGEEGVEELDKNYKPIFVIIAIDTHPVMFRKREDSSVPFKDCLSACHRLANSLLLANSQRSFNQFAVLLAKEEAPCLINFGDNLIDTVKLLESKAALPNKQLADEYQRKGEFDLAAFFLACKKTFHDLKTAYYKRVLIYITDDDDPAKDAAKRFTALNEIKTFSGSDINFEVVSTTPSFDYSKFYNELFSLLDEPPMEQICEDEVGLVEKLTCSVLTRQSKMRIRLFPFKEDFTRALECFKLDFVSASKLLNTKVRKDGQSIKLATETQGEIGGPSSYFKEKGEGVVKFDPYERCCLLDNTIPQGLTLLYVSKRTTDVGYVLSKPFLLAPQEKEDMHFHKFWQCCVKNEKVLVCLLKRKQPGKRRFTELIPVVVNNSPLFLVKYIPFANEIILPKKEEYAEPEEDEDPCYRKKKAYVKAKLLDEPMEEVTDVTFDVSALNEHLREVGDMINKNFVFAQERKRKAPASASRSKKMK
ncbi:hypothetical protein NQ315_006269 [Exocentrus adspersus]|uniref:Ku70/Ku80 N-terminal alpha/beta domain-containing protein n=1 Tax=Exocentrus adspersus TaxID=1586481 RepID=A0AAV8W070_9CUCU|nr:hypothetical protein NQ315_006269 [Exocentrus adspersus]